jgi:hypothetical protein
MNADLVILMAVASHKTAENANPYDPVRLAKLLYRCAVAEEKYELERAYWGSSSYRDHNEGVLTSAVRTASSFVGRTARTIAY